MKRYIATVTGLLVAALLAACATSANLQTVATDIATIATSFNAALNAPAVAQAIPGGLPSGVTQALADLTTVAQAAANAPDAAAMKANVQSVERDVNTIVMALAGLPSLPPNVSTILTAATVLVPTIELAVGIALPSASAATAPMSPATARKTLTVGKAPG